MSYPTPTPGASLLLAFRPTATQHQTLLIIGTNQLAAIRAFAALEAGYHVVVAGAALEQACQELKWRVSRGEVEFVQESDGLEEVLDRGEVRLVCVTDTLLPGVERRVEEVEGIVRMCRARRVPVNVADMPALCDYTFPATHRFSSASVVAGGEGKSPLQLALTTNGHACRLATRLKREVVSALPRDVGRAVENVGLMRRKLAADSSSSSNADSPLIASSPAGSGGEDEEDAARPPLNAPVRQDDLTATESDAEACARRMRWIAQMSEYWPLERLAALSGDEIGDALERGGVAVGGEGEGDGGQEKKRTCPKRRTLPRDDDPTLPRSQHGIHLPPPESKRKGRILLVGSGPGHPSLLTVAARQALTQTATLILSDKLVPAQVLALIPQDKELYIAKKYPGNADGAQNELMDMALEGLRRGEVVVRLKQGDPFLYGRGGEEVLFFRAHGYEPLVIPGVSSALAGPLLAGIPVTQRGVAESLTICTGVGRKGRDVELPGYERARTLVVLMGVARISQLVEALVRDEDGGRRRGKAYPPNTPVAIVERASCADQRTLVSTLRDVEEGLVRMGEQRPPGMIVVGWAALALAGEGDLGVLDDAAGVDEGGLSAKDEGRVKRWLGEERWRVYDGLPNSGTWNLF